MSRLAAHEASGVISARQILQVGESAVLVEHQWPLSVAAALTESPAPGQVDVIPAENSVLVVTSEGVDLRAVRDFLLALAVGSGSAGSSRSVEILVDYDGQDLSDLAGSLQISEAELVRRHTEAAWVVSFVGFAPGFGYLTSPDWDLEVPRLNQPRTAIPAGSVALAHRYSGIYPRASPGGWQLIGRTEASLWDLARDEPALLTSGMRVRFLDSAGSGGSGTGSPPEAIAGADEEGSG